MTGKRGRVIIVITVFPKASGRFWDIRECGQASLLRKLNNPEGGNLYGEK